MSENQRPVLSLAAGYHLRARPLCDGRMTMKSFELKAEPLKTMASAMNSFWPESTMPVSFL